MKTKRKTARLATPEEKNKTEAVLHQVAESKSTHFEMKMIRATLTSKPLNRDIGKESKDQRPVKTTRRQEEISASTRVAIIAIISNKGNQTSNQVHSNRLTTKRARKANSTSIVAELVGSIIVRGW